MNNGTYTLYATDPTQVSSAGLIEFANGVPDQKVLVFSGIAFAGLDTNDDDDVGHPRVFIRLGRFVRSLVSSSVVVGLASISNDDSGFVLATDSVLAQRDGGSGELYLDASCGLSGDGTWIHGLSYQAVCVVEEDTVRIAGEISWSPDLHDASNDTAASIDGLLGVRSGHFVTVPQPGAPPGTFGKAVWMPLSNGRITGLQRRADGWTATYEIVNLPVLVPINVAVDVRPAFANGRTDIGATRVGGPDPIILTGSTPEVDEANFRLTTFSGPR